MTDCLFCRIEKKEIPSRIIHEDDQAIAFEDVNPQAPTHILIIPRRHIASVSEITDQDSEMMGHLALVARRIAQDRGIAAQGYRLVVNAGPAGGQAVYHLHLHLLGGRQMNWPPG